MLAGVADCRRSRKWAAKEDGNWDLNLGPAAIGKKRPCGSEGKKRPCSSEVKERPCGSEVKERPCGSEVKKRPCGSKVNGEDYKVLGEKEETTRLQNKWGGDHAALKEGVNHEALKQVDR